MSKLISVKMDEQIYKTTEKLVRKMGKNRNAYINDAVHFYNRFQERRWLAAQLRKESKLIRETSMEALHEFDQCINDGLENL